MGSDGDNFALNMNSDLLLRQAQQGDMQAREQLVAGLRPFILRIAARVTGRYITSDDDELSVGMLAVNEAIDQYDRKRGSFLSFCDLVVRRRLIDYHRREQKFAAVIHDDQELMRADISLAERQHTEQSQAMEIREEIERYRRELAQYGLDLKMIATVCPRHADARARAQEAARLLAADEEMRSYLVKTKSLSLKQLTLRSGLSRRTLERQRQYVIAVYIILTGDFPHLTRYVQ